MFKFNGPRRTRQNLAVNFVACCCIRFGIDYDHGCSPSKYFRSSRVALFSKKGSSTVFGGDGVLCVNRKGSQDNCVETGLSYPSSNRTCLQTRAQIEFDVICERWFSFVSTCTVFYGAHGFHMPRHYGLLRKKRPDVQTLSQIMFRDAKSTRKVFSSNDCC